MLWFSQCHHGPNTSRGQGGDNLRLRPEPALLTNFYRMYFTRVEISAFTLAVLNTVHPETTLPLLG